MIWAKRIKKLPLGKDSARPQTLRRLLLLMLAIPSWSCASSQAIAQTGDPLGILLAAGDVAGCFQSTRKYTEVADQIQREIDLAGSLPVGVLALGDIAYADRNKQKKVIKGTYEKCFGKFVETWGRYKERIIPVPEIMIIRTTPPERKPAPKSIQLIFGT